jgi:hypothetical protein
MKHPPRAWTREARDRPHAHLYADSRFPNQHSENAKANARHGALHGLVLALAILLIVLPIILLTPGCASQVMATERSTPVITVSASFEH